MRKILMILCILLLFTSCGTTYFYSTIYNKNDDVLQNNDGDFIYETDSLLVAYWFNGENAPVYINVFNKSNTPLYIDWSRSALIIQDETVSLNNSRLVRTEGYSRGITYNVNRVSVNEGSYKSYTEVPESVTFIPPNSRRTFNPIYLADFDFSAINKNRYAKAKMATKNGELFSVQTLQFSEENTPLDFRCYLTMYRDDNKQFNVEKDFYVSSVIKSRNLSPSKMNDHMFNRGDLFYAKKENNTGRNISLGAAIVGLIVVDAALGAIANGE